MAHSVVDQAWRSLRRSKYTTIKKADVSDRLMPHTAPLSPKAHVAGTPTTSDMAVAAQKA